MDDVKFREIAASVIMPYGDRLISRYSELIWRPNWQDYLQSTYDAARLCIHAEMRKFPDILDHRIDRHKIAAAFTKAIMETSPLLIKEGTSRPSDGARLANETLAFLTSVRIVRQILIKRFKDVPGWSEKIADATIRFPPATDGDYPEHAYKAFFSATHSSLNFFILANLYFLIESYHLQSLGWNKPVPNLPEQH